MGKIVGGTAIEGNRRRIKGVSKAKGKAKFNRTAHSFRKRAGYRLDSLQIWGISMINNIKLIKIV